jgi:hypothetical protein
MGTPAAARYDDFAEWKRKVDTQLRQALSRAATRPQAAVSSGGIDISGDGALRVVGSGGISMVSGDGVEIFSVKGWTGVYNEPDGEPQPMMIMRRADGSTAFLLGDPLPNIDGYQQFWALFDRTGTIIFGDDTTSGRGLARPYMGFSVLNENGTDYVTPTSTTSFATVHTIAGYIQNPRMMVPVTATATAGGPGEIQIIYTATGEVVAGPTSIPVSSSISPFYNFLVPDSAGLFTHQYFEVQTRRVSGTGNIQSRVWSAQGMQS